MGKDKDAKVENPADPPVPPIPPVPPDPPVPPIQPPVPGPRPFLLPFSLFQAAVLLGFFALAVAIAVVSSNLPAASASPDTAKSMFRLLTVLVTSAAACLFFAWLDEPNLQLLGSGLRGLLTVHRAALSAFLIAAGATIAVSIFVALSSLFSGGPEDGVYALASIEFLLKLTAVSAIIVLITLRRAVRTREVDRAVKGSEGEAADVASEQEVDDRGPREFGSLAFAFSLVVIAALIVPRDDLVRLGSAFFGGDKVLEDYMPSRAFVVVEADLSKQIAATVAKSFAHLRSMPALTDAELLSIEGEVSTVLATNLIDQVERRGALPLLKAICENQEDDLVFSHADEREMAEHLEYLTEQGLVEYPYADARRIGLTRYGWNAVKSSRQWNCPQESLSPTVFVPDQSTDDETPAVPDIQFPKGTDRFEHAFRLTETGSTFNVKLPVGSYRAELVAKDDVDPFLTVVDLQTGAGKSDDDGGPGLLDSAVDFTVEENGQLLIAARSQNKLSGDAVLRVSRVAVAPSGEPFSSAMPETPDEAVELDRPLIVRVTRGGTLVTFTPEVSGNYEIAVTNGRYDAVARLLGGDIANPAGMTVIKESDDEGSGLDPLVRAPLTGGTTYYLWIDMYDLPPGVATDTGVAATLAAGAEQRQAPLPVPDETPVPTTTVVPTASASAG